MEKKSNIDKKKNGSATVEELTEYGGVIDKKWPSRHVYFSDSTGAEKIRVKSKDGKRKKGKGSDNVGCTLNDGDMYSLNTDINDGICEVKVVAETSKDDSKNTKEKGKRGGDMDKVSNKGKKKVSDDKSVREGKNYVSGEDEKVEDVEVRKKVADYEEVNEDNQDHTNVVGTKKVVCGKESNMVLNDKEVGKNKDNSKGKSRDKAKDMEGRKKVARDKEVRKDKEKTIGDGEKKEGHVKERKNGKHTESCLTETLEGEPINGRKKIEDTNATSDKGCFTLNSQDKGKRTKKTISAELEKHGKKKSNKVKKDKVEAIDEVFGSDKQARDKEVNANNEASNIKKRKVNADHSTKFSPKKKSKTVRFSEEVELFPLSNDMELEEENCEEKLIQGKRFSWKEDAIIKESVSNYIMAHRLGEEGLYMILHCRSHSEVRGCWKEIGAALPWRPCQSVYYRAHILFEGGDDHTWSPDQIDLLKRFHEKHGSNWKVLATMLGKHRFHVKDAWRKIKVPNLKKGSWSQNEYQTLFELVNKDLQMKAFEEKKTKHGMLRDNIAWESISDKLSTRNNPDCCKRWYYQLASSMVAEGIWNNSDDYRLLAALLKVDASCVDDVDWDNLLDHRPGEVCLKRWSQMGKHIGEHRDKTFAEQVEVLSNRYIPNLVEVVED